MSKSETKTLSIKLSRSLAMKVSAISRRRGVSKSDVVRDALEAYEPRTGSVTELAADLCGIVAGPRDLSTNSEHLADYGK
jgi:hypothetical protein